MSKPTKEFPFGRCERCGQAGSAHDDLVQRDVPFNGYDRLCNKCQGEAENVASVPRMRVRTWTTEEIIALFDRVESVLDREPGDGQLTITRRHGHVVVSAGSRFDNNGPEVEGHSLDEAMTALVADLDRWEADK